MQLRSIQFQRLLIVAFLALMQLFAPLVHAHTGDSRQDGMHVHIPGADTHGSGPVLSADPGMEIGVETMRRESGDLQPEFEPPALSCLSGGTREIAAGPLPSPAWDLAPLASRISAAHPSRGPPAAPAC